MNTRSNPPMTRRPGRLIICLIAAATVGAVAALPVSAGAQHTKAAKAKSTLLAHKRGMYGEVLTNSAGRSLYVLSTESKGKLHCTSKACTTFWPPLVVAKGAKITAGSGVKGKVSHVVRGSKWQVTYNGWPVYTFSGDSGPAQTKGEGQHADGGIWYLLRATAKTNSATPIKTGAPGGISTTTTTPGY